MFFLGLERLMYVNVAVLKETHPHERRVALVPSVVPKLIKLGAKLHMQTGAANAVKFDRRRIQGCHLHRRPQGIGRRRRCRGRGSAARIGGHQSDEGGSHTRLLHRSTSMLNRRSRIAFASARRQVNDLVREN